MRILAALCAALFIGGASAQEYPNCRGFIEVNCCCSNSCCWEIGEHEVRSLPNDNWEIRSTGQVVKRTDYSPDGRYYRCACDYDGKTGRWNRHQGANTRCLYVPFQGS